MRSNAYRRGSVRAAGAVASGLALGLSLSACAGGAGRSAEGAGGGEGFSYGAPQEEVNALVEDLEPLTLTYQASAASANSVLGPVATEFKELVEERSNGKITVEIVWGQAIAPYSEVHDALADGRIDVAFTLPVYQPAEFPAVNDLATAMAVLPSSPYQGDIVANAVGVEQAWQNENVLDQYAEKGLVPLTPMVANGGYYTICAEPMADRTDWRGLQIRAASTAQIEQAKDLGASPVSMEYTEVFDALQRHTVDCTFGQMESSAEAGIFEVAPHGAYLQESSFTRAPGAYLAGKSFAEMPLAYQQIVFDSNALAGAGEIKATLDGNALALRLAAEADGEIAPFSDEVQRALADSATNLIDEVAAGGQVPEDIEERLTRTGEDWRARLDELGIADAGSMTDFVEWYDEDVDLLPYAKALYEEGPVMEHRPA